MKRLRGGTSLAVRRLGGTSVWEADPEHSNDIEVVGVVKDAKYQDLRERPFPAAYYPYTQHVQYLNDFEVRYSGNPEVIIAEVRQAIGQVDHSLPVAYEGTMVEQVNRSMAGQTLIARLSTFFGLLAAFLACIGIYGLMSYAVTRRTNEIGIRMALGAERSGVLWMVMRESLMLVAVGVAIGIPGGARGRPPDFERVVWPQGNRSRDR